MTTQPHIAFGLTLCLAAFGSAVAQDAPASRAATRTAATTQPESRPDDAAARALFMHAVAAQTPDPDPVAIADFQADIQATLYDLDPQTGRRATRSATVTEFFRAATADGRELFRRDLVDLAGAVTMHAYDGKIYWQKNGTGPVQALRGADFAQDRDRVIDEKRRTREVLDLMVLANLPDRERSTFQKLATPTTLTIDGEQKPVAGVTRSVPGARPIDLFFDPKTATLVGFRRPAVGKTPEQLITFSHHAAVMAGKSRVITPLVIEYRENGVPTIEARVKSVQDLKINTGISDAVFQMPRQ